MKKFLKSILKNYSEVPFLRGCVIIREVYSSLYTYFQILELSVVFIRRCCLRYLGLVMASYLDLAPVLERNKKYEKCFKKY